jgi:hypothetical protein
MRMHLHHLPTILFALLMATAVTMASGGIALTPVAASPAKHAIAMVTVGTKVTLPETSIDGPGFASTEIAWTGTDAAHHLNVASGTDGLHFPNKTVFPETSPVGPAFIVGEIPGVGDHTSSLAWIGTDATHHLNVEFGTPLGTKLKLPETSFATPAIGFGVFNGTKEWLLAWTGSDANHSLNVLPITASSSGTPVLGKKTVLPQFSSDAGPSLATGTSELVLGWSVRGTRQLNLAESTDGVHFTSALGAGLPETSATAPQFMQPGGNSSGCIAWTGTDSAHHLNVQCTTQFPQFPDPATNKTKLAETALGVPGFANNEIAWTGTDAAHHLNVAQLQGL